MVSGAKGSVVFGKVYYAIIMELVCHNADRQKYMTVSCERRMNPQTVVAYGLGILLLFKGYMVGGIITLRWIVRNY